MAGEIVVDLPLHVQLSHGRLKRAKAPNGALCLPVKLAKVIVKPSADLCRAWVGIQPGKDLGAQLAPIQGNDEGLLNRALLDMQLVTHGKTFRMHGNFRARLQWGQYVSLGLLLDAMAVAAMRHIKTNRQRTDAMRPRNAVRCRPSPRAVE